MDKTVHHYLHEKAFGTTTAKRVDANTVVCRFGDKEYRIPANERDQRTLVVFDGELLFGGLPRSATVVQSVSLGFISCPAEAMRKSPEYPCEALPKYHKERKKTGIEIFRHFLFLPSCTAIMRKFRNKSLSPIYTIISVFVNEKGTIVVEWQTTSY